MQPALCVKPHVTAVHRAEVENTLQYNVGMLNKPGYNVIKKIKNCDLCDCK